MKVDKYGFGYIELEDDVIQSLNSDISAASNMINDFNNINEVIVWAFSSHDAKNNMYRVNIRSRGPVINEIAAKYHGGGHKQASGVKMSEYEYEAYRKEYELLLVASDSFGTPGFVRISYCVSTEQIQRSLPAFKKLAEVYRD